MKQITSLGSALALKKNKISSPLLAQTLSFQYSLTASLALNSSLKAVWDGGFLGAGPTWPAPLWVVLEPGLVAHSSLGNGFSEDVLLWLQTKPVALGTLLALSLLCFWVGHCPSGNRSPHLENGRVCSYV